MENLSECDGFNKDVKLPAPLRRARQTNTRQKTLKCWFHGEITEFLGFTGAFWISYAHIYLISLDGGLLLLLLLPYGVVFLLKFLQLFLADLLSIKSRKKKTYCLELIHWTKYNYKQNLRWASLADSPKAAARKESIQSFVNKDLKLSLDWRGSL